MPSVKGRRHRCLLEQLESRTYFSGTSNSSVGVDLASGTPTRIYRTPAFMQNGTNLKASPSTLQNAQAYFNLVQAAVPPTLTTAPVVTFLDPSEMTASLTAAATPDNGADKLTYTWVMQSGSASNPPTFSTNGANDSQQTTVTFHAAGDYVFQVLVSDGLKAVAGTVAVHVDSIASHLVVVPGMTNGTNGAIRPGATSAFSAIVTDQFGQTFSTDVAWSVDAGGGSISAAGVYQAPVQSGSVTVRATAAGLTATATIDISNAAPTVATPAGATGSTLTTTSTTLSVLGADDGGESGLSYSWSLTSGPAAVAFSANNTNGAKNTTVTFAHAGTYSFLVTISDGQFTTTSAVTLTVAQKITSIVVTPATGSLNLNGSTAVSATALDQFGDALTVQPTFTWSNTGAGSVNASGQYSAGTTGGTGTVTAAAGGVSGSTTIAVANAAPTVVTPAGGPSTVTGITAQLTALGGDDAGESGIRYTWSLTSGPAAVTFSANGNNAAKATTVTFTKAGTYSFLVTLSDGSLTTTSAVTLTVSQTLTSILVSPNSFSLALNQTRTLTATGYDQFGQALSAQPTFTWSKVAGVGTINAAGVFSSGTTAGSATISVSSSGVSTTATATVGNNAPTVAMPASGPTTVAGTTAALSVLGADDGGEAGLTYSWSLVTGPAAASFSANNSNAAKATTVTFSKAGTYSFLVVVSDGSLTTTSSVTLTVNQTATSIVVSPGSAAMNLNGTRSLSATAYDQFGAAMTVQPTFIWSKTAGVGSVSSGGVYSAGTTAGSATIVASASGVTGTAAMTVTNAAPTVATPASGPSSVSGTTAALSVLGADDGGASGLTYTWSLVSGPAAVSYSANGANAAKTTTVTFAKAGTYSFLVTLSDGSLTTTSSVTLSVNQTATTILVSPGTMSVNALAVQQFSAAAYDQFGALLTVQPTFTWSVDSGGAGSVASNGAFTAAAGAGSATVRAAGGGVSGTAAVTVVGTPTGSAVTLSTKNLTSFTELVITGTTGNDTISVSQSGNTFTIVSNGITQTITGTFGDLAIHAGGGGSTITVDASVTINTLVYGGAGTDTINDYATGAYNAIVTIGGGADAARGNGVNTNYWIDSADGATASITESSGGYVHSVAQFFQPWTSNTASADYVGLELQGQNLRDPSDSGGAIRYTATSLWGTVPLATDVRQGGLNDCYFLSGIDAVAFSDPYHLMNAAVDLGDGTYCVQFQRNGVKYQLRVDGDFGGGGAVLSASHDLWPLVLEKAFAFFRAVGANTYASLNNGGNIEPFAALGMNTLNRGTFYATLDSAGFASMILSELAAHRAISYATPATIVDGAPLVASHAYAIVGVEVTGGVYTYLLRNPWGYDGLGSDGDPSDGVIHITNTQLKDNGSFVYEGYFS
jgi:hypothetical protein